MTDAPLVYPKMRVGLLGGSFNPAHDGHRHISLLALRRLRLDQVWWLVSPQNPLKATAGMAPFSKRIDGARQVAAHPAIHVSSLEEDLGTQYTADTIDAIQGRYPGVNFVWLMGSDNLIQLPLWRRWTDIMESVPVAVFARPGSVSQAANGQAAQRYARARLPDHAGALLPSLGPPAWVFLHDRQHPESATRLRRLKKGKG